MRGKEEEERCRGRVSEGDRLELQERVYVRTAAHTSAPLSFFIYLFFCLFLGLER